MHCIALRETFHKKRKTKLLLHSTEKEQAIFVFVRHLLTILLSLIYLLPVVHPANSTGYLLVRAQPATQFSAAGKCCNSKQPLTNQNAHKQHKHQSMRTHASAVSFATTVPLYCFTAVMQSSSLNDSFSFLAAPYFFDATASIWHPPRMGA